MTHQEHQLMVAMFAGQLQLIKAVTEVLKTNNLLKTGDFPAFIAAATNLNGSANDLIDEAERRYRTFALELGVPVPAKIV